MHKAVIKLLALYDTEMSQAVEDLLFHTFAALQKWQIYL